MSIDMYRIHVGLKSGGASTGRTTYYESREAFRKALLVAAIQCATGPGTREFRERFKLKMRKQGDWQVTQIYRAQHLVDGEWVDVPFVLVMPELRLDGDVEEVPA